MDSQLKRRLRLTGIVIGGLLLGIVLALSLMDWNVLRRPIERIASAKSGHTVRLAGDLQVRLWSWTPTATVNRLTLGGPTWEADRPLATVERLEVQWALLPLLKGEIILPRVALLGPQLYLHRDRSGRANWTFENLAPTNTPASRPVKLPLIRDLIIADGRLIVNDEIRRLAVQGTIQAHEQAAPSDPTPFHIEGHGTLNGEPFRITVAGGPLIHLDPEHPYRYDLNISAGDLQVRAAGQLLKPFDLARVDTDVAVSGQDLAEGFYLTQLALPNTAPFTLRAHVARNGLRIAVTDITGQVGASDLHGALDIDATRKRPSMTGDLVSAHLRLKDLAASLGVESPARAPLDTRTPHSPGTSTAVDPRPAAAPAAAPKPLFPDAHLQVNRVRAMDADVRFRADSIDAGSVPFTQVSLRVRLHDGVLTLEPFAFDLPQGKLAGDVTIDARSSLPRVHLDIHARDIQLDQFKGKAADAAAPLAGIMQARLVLEGSGDSVHQVMADANGRFTLVLPEGEVNSAFAELTGINVARGIGLLLTHADEKARIRCGVAQFAIRDGTANAQILTFDTQNVLITGQGDIRLGPEQLNLQISGKPKKFRFTRVRSPVEITGYLTAPRVGIDLPAVLEQGAVAAALGTLLTPLAAVIAFVDPGLAKNQNCAKLMGEAELKPPARTSQRR